MNAQATQLQPRIISRSALAGYLGRSPSWLSSHKDELAGLGFPTPVSVLGGYDRRQVDAWVDGLSENELKTNNIDADGDWSDAENIQI